jgi:hypothetical protein
LAASDFYLFGKVKGYFSRSNFGDDDEVLDEIRKSCQSIPAFELKRVFISWKGRCVWVAEENGEWFPEE